MRKLKTTFAALLLLAGYGAYAQDTLHAGDTLTQSVSKIISDLDALKKLKFSGYIQAQFQVADSAGTPNVFAGGPFLPGVDKRFTVRRGRLKAMYTGNLSTAVLQIDITERQVVIKDAYLAVTDPWSKYVTLTAGIFNRPFGFEVGYSSGLRESPERSRMIQTLFPGERDLGAMITLQAPKTSPLSAFKAEGGMFNGTGPVTTDFDFQKDFIGRVRMDKSLMEEKLSLGLGVSYYKGGYRNPNNAVFETIGAVNDSTTGFIAVDSTIAPPKGTINNRQYYGADLQLSFDFPFGMTTLRGEYITGVQPSTKSTNVSPPIDPATDTYVRNFNGAYFYFIQNIGKSKHQLIVKYDWYDANSDVSGDEIGKAGSRLTKTDLRYDTWGFGYTYHWDHNIKFVVYYDKVKNETSKNLTGGDMAYQKDIKDDVLTLRVQYKF